MEFLYHDPSKQVLFISLLQARYVNTLQFFTNLNSTRLLSTRGQRTVSFVQIFRSRKHSLKLSYYEEMRKVIADVIPEEFTCEVIFAIPTGHDCTGLTNCSGGLENWDKAIKVVQFERTA